MPLHDYERRAMARARELALLGPRGVNPQVGCVLLRADGTTLAEGWHRGVGTAHAEVDALHSLAPGAAHGATAVVTLEPCNHTGRTGPCAEALLAAGIARVVYAVEDPGAVSSGGAARLAAAGVDIDRCDEHEGAALIENWLFAATHGRPKVTVKWAQSLDGRAAAADGTSKWITGAAAREHVHQQRAAHDAIAVGTGTVLADDPQLTARAGGPQPLPIVLGTRPVPDNARLHLHPRGFLQRSGPLDETLAGLWADGIQTLYVEGGPTVASAFLRAGLADRIHLYLAPKLLGGGNVAIGDVGVLTIDDARVLEVAAIERLGADIFIEAREQHVHRDH